MNSHVVAFMFVDVNITAACQEHMNDKAYTAAYYTQKRPEFVLAFLVECCCVVHPV